MAQTLITLQNLPLKCTFLSFFLFYITVSSSLFAQENASTPPPRQKSTLNFDEAYRLALKQSETVAMAQIQVDRAASGLYAATGDAIGEGTFRMTQFRQDESFGSAGAGGSTSTSLKEVKRERKFVFEQPLFQGLHSFGLFTQGFALWNQRSHEGRRTEELLFLDVANAFYTVLELKHDVQITDEIISLLKDRMKELDQWERIGKSRPSEIATAEAVISTQEAELARLKGDVLVAKRLLEYLTGETLEDITLVDGGELRDGPSEMSTYLASAEKRSDVKAKKNAARVAFGELISAQSGLWPQISVDTNVYHKREGFQSAIDYDTFFTIDVPLYTGGETLSEIVATVNDWRAARLDYKRQKRIAELEIKQAYDHWITSLAEFDALRRAVEKSMTNYTLQSEEYQKNLVNNLDVLAALNSLNEAKRSENRAYYEAKRFHHELQVATGVLNESL